MQRRAVFDQIQGNADFFEFGFSQENAHQNEYDGFQLLVPVDSLRSVTRPPTGIDRITIYILETNAQRIQITEDSEGPRILIRIDNLANQVPLRIRQSLTFNDALDAEDALGALDLLVEDFLDVNEPAVNLPVNLPPVNVPVHGRSLMDRTFGL